MKVITLKQPWATLVSMGLKEYEFRSWKINYRGDILIHAGKGIDKEAMGRFKHLNLNYPTSKIIAKVTIVNCIKLDETKMKEIIAKNPLIYNFVTKDGYAWKLENFVKIKDIDISGKQGIWNIDCEDN